MQQDSANKRQQIVTAALQCFRNAGVGGTTLKVVAEVSGVPLGNLYYYFNTRHALVLAVLDHCEQELERLLSRWAGQSPVDWIAAYFDWLLEDPAATPTLGCPFGALAIELRALRDPAAARASEIVDRYARAIGVQVMAMDHSAAFAEELFLAIQGTYTVAQALDDPALFRRSIERLRTHTLRAPPV